MSKTFNPITADRAKRLKKKTEAQAGQSPKLKELLVSLQRTAEEQEEAQHDEQQTTH